MKIAYLANVRFPSERAHSVQIAHMCESFVKAGSEVDLYVSKRQAEEAVSVTTAYGFASHFSVFRLYPKRVYPRLKFTFYVSEFLFALHFLLVKTEQYDVIYSRSEWILWFLSFFCESKSLAWESHEAKYTLPARTLLRKKIKTVVISQGIFEFYLKKNVSSQQMVVADDGIDESFFSESAIRQNARADLGLKSQARIAMYIGGLDKWKGVDTFMESQQYCEGVEFVVIGGSETELMSWKNRYPDVTFLGQRPYKNLSRLQQAADVLVVPNTAKNQLSNKYTSPLKLFAHMASGVPLVITDLPSLTTVTGRDLVTISEPDNPIAMADAILSVLSHYEKKRKAAGELKKVARKYTWQSRASIILSHLRLASREDN